MSTYDRRKALGLCTRCGSAKDSSLSECEKCLNYSRNKSKKLDQKRHNNGLCVRCGQPKDNSELNCVNCLEEYKLKGKKREIECRQIGMCPKCGLLKEDFNKSYCINCLIKASKYSKDKRDVRLDLNLCTYCGKKTPEEYLVCNDCRAKISLKRVLLKKEVMMNYGGKCQCCEIDDLIYLTIDHINNDGAKHRKETTDLYHWLKKNNYPENNFQILCFNCNMGKYLNGGQCPHIKEVRKLSKYRLNYRSLIFEHYGKICVCCAERQRIFLSIDHIENDGRKHRNTDVAFWIVRNNFPKGFQILCFNCNCAKKLNGGKLYVPN